MKKYFNWTISVSLLLISASAITYTIHYEQAKHGLPIMPILKKAILFSILFLQESIP